VALWQTLGSYRSTGPSVTADVALLAAMSAQINLHPYAKYCIKFVSVWHYLLGTECAERHVDHPTLQCPAVPVPRKNPAPLMEGESAAVCCVCTAWWPGKALQGPSGRKARDTWLYRLYRSGVPSSAKQQDGCSRKESMISMTTFHPHFL
jgi:hypothetical protein